MTLSPIPRATTSPALSSLPGGAATAPTASSRAVGDFPDTARHAHGRADAQAQEGFSFPSDAFCTSSRAEGAKPGTNQQVAPLRVLDLFSGIGGFSLGLERTGGFQTVAFCEIEEFPRRVLAKHWPGVPCYDDVRTLTGARLAADGITGIDVITGGFPCQDLSVAGKQRGMGEGTRSGLWSEIVRLAGELRPDFLIVENVAALLSGPSDRRGGWFGRVLGDLAEIRYDAEWHCIPASFLGAWHERDRVWILANPSEKLWERVAKEPILRQSDLSQQLCGRFAEWPGRSALPPSRFCRRGDGVPHRMDRLGALGNAVVPAIPELIGRAILASREAAQVAL